MIYTGKVVKIVDFGAFVNFLGSRDGLVHISELVSDRRPQTVGEDGLFYPHVPLFAGASVYTADGKEGTANEAVIAKLVERLK